MKIRFLSFTFAMLLLFTSCVSNNSKSDDITLTASFYPVYVALLNITDGISGISVSNLTEHSGGCLHDYSLTTADLKALSGSDMLFINGAGMEPFINKISDNMPNLPIVDTSADISLLEENPHIWMSIDNHITQVTNISERLCLTFPEYKDRFSANCVTYIAKLEALKDRLETELAPYSGAKLITFHEAFHYFADEFNLKVAATIVHDEHSAPTPRDIENTIELINTNNIHAIFAEPGNSDSAIQTISDATGTSVYTLDPITTGANDKDAYIDAMEQNLNTLKDALKG